MPAGQLRLRCKAKGEHGDRQRRWHADGGYRCRARRQYRSNLLARLQEPWLVPCKEAKPIARPDLQSIQDTLPPHKPGRDRTFRIEKDGVIVYEKEEGDWEPPQDINGYERDSHDPWRFIPLWPPCAMRHQIGVRYASCGCIGIVMRCNHPRHPKHTDRVGHEDCQTCPFRKSEK